jgi:TPR repeat protein
MRILWKQLAITLVLTSALAPANSTAQVRAPLQAQPQTPPTGIDPALLAKARAGDAVSQKLVGFAYVEGKGIPQDYVQAAYWFRKAAEQGIDKAQYDLGLLYENGQGVGRDYAQAAMWYRKAAEQGYSNAQTNLALLYEDGRGIPQDYAQAASWYRKAAEQGYADAQNNLALLYENGRGVPQDYAQAAKWCRKAAEQGDAQAQYNLGNFYDSGRGVPRDNTKALVWFHKAAEQGNAQALSYLARAQREADEAKNSQYVAVTARGVSVVPGAIVCPSYEAVSMMFDLYAAHWEDTTQDAMTNGQSRLIRGEPAPAPDLKSRGCTLLPSGTPMMLERGSVVPVVTAKLANGKTIRGVTLPAMIVGP